MRLKFVLGDGHRTVDVIDYTFSAGPPPSVRFERKEGKIETVEVMNDVFVMNDRGDTIDRLRKER